MFKKMDRKSSQSLFHKMSWKKSFILVISSTGVLCGSVFVNPETALASTTEYFNSHSQINVFFTSVTSFSLDSTTNVEIYGSESGGFFNLSNEEVDLIIHGYYGMQLVPSVSGFTSTIDYYESNGSMELSEDPSNSAPFIANSGDLVVANENSPNVGIGPVPSTAVGTAGYYINAYPESELNIVEVNL